MMILCLGRNDWKLDEIGRLLRGAGYQTFLCLDPADAVRVIEHQAIRVVVSDELLATTEGRQILEKARSLRPNIPIVYLPATADLSPAVLELDPDVIIKTTAWKEELCAVIAILNRR